MSDILADELTLQDLDVQLMKLEDRAGWELKPWRKLRYYEEKVGEIPPPDPPQILATL